VLPLGYGPQPLHQSSLTRETEILENDYCVSNTSGRKVGAWVRVRNLTGLFKDNIFERETLVFVWAVQWVGAVNMSLVLISISKYNVKEDGHRRREEEKRRDETQNEKRGDDMGKEMTGEEKNVKRGER